VFYWPVTSERSEDLPRLAAGPDQGNLKRHDVTGPLVRLTAAAGMGTAGIIARNGCTWSPLITRQPALPSP